MNPKGNRRYFLSASCPDCGDVIQFMATVKVTSRQPSGPPGTPRAVTVSWQPNEDRRRIIATHHCVGDA